MDPKLKQDYMDIDEFLNAGGLNGLALPESDYTDDDFNSIPDNSDFDGNLGPLLSESIPKSINEFTSSTSRGSPVSPGSQVSSDEGRGGSIASSESVVSGQSSGSENNTGKSKRKKNPNAGKNPKRTRTQRSKTKNNNAKANLQLATAVDINGVKYSYSIETEGKGKRQRTSVPGEMKDQKYWERRLKNNVAAKRSRDLKRQKEMTVAKRAQNLEIENEKLRNEVTMLKKRLQTLNGKLDESENV